VKISAIDSAFERALSAEIAASELLRVRVLAVTLAVLLVGDELLFLCNHPASTAAGSDQAAAAWGWDVFQCQGSSSCNLAAG
jgi:hypothetical protein